LHRLRESLEQLKHRKARLQRELCEVDKLVATAEYNYARLHMNSLLNQHG
jgi:hypothetical protein